MHVVWRFQGIARRDRAAGCRASMGTLFLPFFLVQRVLQVRQAWNVCTWASEPKIIDCLPEIAHKRQADRVVFVRVVIERLV